MARRREKYRPSFPWFSGRSSTINDFYSQGNTNTAFAFRLLDNQTPEDCSVCLRNIPRRLSDAVTLDYHIEVYRCCNRIWSHEELGNIRILKPAQEVCQHCGEDRWTVRYRPDGQRWRRCLACNEVWQRVRPVAASAQLTQHLERIADEPAQMDSLVPMAPRTRTGTLRRTLVRERHRPRGFEDDLPMSGATGQPPTVGIHDTDDDVPEVIRIARNDPSAFAQYVLANMPPGDVIRTHNLQASPGSGVLKNLRADVRSDENGPLIVLQGAGDDGVWHDLEVARGNTDNVQFRPEKTVPLRTRRRIKL